MACEGEEVRRALGSLANTGETRQSQAKVEEPGRVETSRSLRNPRNLVMPIGMA